MFTCRLALFLLTLGISYQKEEEGEDPCKTGDYKVYPNSTLHKTVSDFTAWNRAKRSVCDLHVNVHCFDKDLAEENKNCGDCDYDLDSGTWYRFSEPNDRIVVIETEGECPPQGHCNGYYALTLLRSNSTNFYFVVISGHVRKDVPSACTAFPLNNIIDKTHMVEMRACSDDVVLYRFPDSLNNISFCSHETNITCGSNSSETGILYTPASWCLTGNTTKPRPDPKPDPEPDPKPDPESDPKPDPEPNTQAKPDPQKALLIGMNSAVLVVLLVALILFVVHKFYTRKKPIRIQPESREPEDQAPPVAPNSVWQDPEEVPENAKTEKVGSAAEESQTVTEDLSRSTELDPLTLESQEPIAQRQEPIAQKIEPEIKGKPDAASEGSGANCTNNSTGKGKLSVVEVTPPKVKEDRRGERGKRRRRKVQTVQLDNGNPEFGDAGVITGVGDADLSEARLQEEDGVVPEVHKKKRKKKKRMDSSDLAEYSNSDKKPLV